MEKEGDKLSVGIYSNFIPFKREERRERDKRRASKNKNSFSLFLWAQNSTQQQKGIISISASPLLLHFSNVLYIIIIWYLVAETWWTFASFLRQ